LANSRVEVQRCISRLKPGIVVPALLAVGLLVYYGVLAVQYRHASGEVDAMTARIAELSGAAVPVKPPDIEVLRAELEAHERQAADLRTLFSHPQTTDLMAIVSRAAHQAKASLTSMTVGTPQPETVRGTRYQVQPITVTLSAAIADIYRFLDALHEEAPVAGVSDISIANLDTVPSARIQLLFYLHPERVPESNEAD